jgi:organic hydroperoxide reductase OsmC/OhrA
MAGEGGTTFSISATWDPAAREGRLANADGSFAIVHTGAPALDGKGGTANPEELLLAAVAACFVQTWGIFLGKLKVPIDAPRLDATCLLEKDPAGGFHVTRIDLLAHVPAALLEGRKADVEKTLSLAEKYCIVSKAVKGSVALTVAPKPA